MGFKMKGSPIKLGNIATKSALKQSTITNDNTEKIDDKYLPSDLSTVETNRKGNMFKKRKGSHGSSGGEVAWMRDTYGPRFLQNASKKEMRNARMAYFDLIQASSSGDPYTEESTTEESTTEKPMIKTIHEKGEDKRSELAKALDKGYFNIGEGSEYLSNRPSPSDYDNAADFTAAVKEWELTNPEKQ
tara:strand:+ start:254 stop:817 length:564 start_codon:yes stop_codon:yes gene_type:complete